MITVEELIEVLKEMPKKAKVNFQVGDGEKDAYRHAKVQLRAGDALSFLNITQIQMHRYFDDEPDDDMMVDIMLHDHCWTTDAFTKYIRGFDEVAKDVDFKAAVHGEDKY